MPADPTVTAQAAGAATLPREFTLWSAYSLAFAFISPIVGLYSIFALGLSAAGPGFVFGFPVVLLGQTLVACVFGMLASRYPYEGSIYQWSKWLCGKRYAWFAGWIYQWGLPIGMSAVTLGGAHFLAELLGLNAESTTVTAALALGLLAFSTWGNTHGRRILNAVVGLCVFAELIASLGVGALLLWRYQVNPLHVLWSTPRFFGAGYTIGDFFTSKAASAIALCGWALLGFESAGSIAEEVRNPAYAVPRAIVWSLWSVAIVVSFAALALTLSIPNLEQVVAGNGGDGVERALVSHLGLFSYKCILLLFMLGFVASMIGVQASVSRVTWAFARDDELPCAAWLKQLSPSDGLPVNAVLASAGVSAILILVSVTNLYPTLVAFTTASFYIAFGFPIFAAVWQRSRGRWQNGPFHLGWATGPVIYLAAGWIVFETINITWPRDLSAPWYERWVVPLMIGALVISGLSVRHSIERSARRNLKPS